MNVDLTITISVILGLSSTIVPVIGQIITAHHGTKIKRMEIEEGRFTTFEIHKRDLLEQAISDLANFSVCPKSETLSEACISLSRVLPYLTDTGYSTARILLDTEYYSPENKTDFADEVIDEMRNLLQTITMSSKPKWHKQCKE